LPQADLPPIGHSSAAFAHQAPVESLLADIEQIEAVGAAVGLQALPTFGVNSVLAVLLNKKY
jgi:hypothetical protein